MKKNIILLILAVLIVIIVIGGVLCYFLLKEKIFLFSPKEEAGSKDSEIVSEAPKVSLPKVLYNLAGTIKEIENQTILLEASIPQIDEAGQPVAKREMRRVKITNLTKFSLLTFVETQPGRKTPQETSITFKNLKVGDYIDVISNQDISQAEEFEATQIRVLPR